MSFRPSVVSGEISPVLRLSFRPEHALRAEWRNLLYYVSDTTYPYFCLPFVWGGGHTRERVAGEVENLNNIFFFVILSDSEGSLCPTVAKFGRCLGNARSISYCIQPYRRAARHDRSVERLRAAPLGDGCHFDCSE